MMGPYIAHQLYILIYVFQVISDFDMTLSRFRDSEGQLCDSSYGNCNFQSVQTSQLNFIIPVHMKK